MVAGALVLAAGGCSRISRDSDAKGQTSSVANESSSARPRKPELPEVATAKYYVAFETIDWPRAVKLLRVCQSMWIEENQAGRAYLTLFPEGQAEEQYVTQVPVGIHVDKLARQVRRRSGCDVVIKHMRYEQIPWTRALQLLRGEVPGQKVTAVMAAHHDRVFITTDQGAELLAIESPDNAMAEFVERMGPNGPSFSFAVE